MKKFISFLILSFSVTSFAGISTLTCSVISNPNKAALVAGEKFEITIDSDFGYNGNFEYKVTAHSAYLGTCEGMGTENMNPLAEGFAGSVSVTGSHCAADGFDIFMSPSLSGIVQVGSEEESIFYSCLKRPALF